MTQNKDQRILQLAYEIKELQDRRADLLLESGRLADRIMLMEAEIDNLYRVDKDPRITYNKTTK